MFDERYLKPFSSRPRALGLTALLLACLGSIALAPAAVGAPHRILQAAPEVQVQEPAREEPMAGGFEHALRTDDGRIQVIIELEDPSAAAVFSQAMEGALPSDKQARERAGAASKAQVLRNQAAQEIVARELTASTVDAREVFRVAKAMNAISVAIDPANLRNLQKIKGIKRVLPVYPEHPTSATSVPFLGTPNVWGNTTTPPLPMGADGTGIRIGVIDTGIDYLHANFGGTGALADYNAEKTATANYTTAGSFPTGKIVGGTDFAGDAYTGANSAVPDANPMDCGGHGSHVSGTAAGFGVTTAGATYGGPYNNAAPLGSLRILPGTAPKASLYALRVFGCGGSTGLTVQAIDWAMDPNGDSDLSDHLDVINMSLGSDFGADNNPTSVASNNAALAGVIVVISAGNAADTFFIAGAPGVATRAIATAASVDAGESFESVRVNPSSPVAGSYLGGSAAFGPAPSGQTATVVLAVDPTAPAACGPDPNDGCCALTNAAAMAGNICIVNRGTCSFKTKTLNCQNAGAIGVIVVNNAPGSPPPGMADDATIVTAITIPTEMVTLVDGNNLKANLPFNGTLLGQPGGDTLASFSSRGPRRIFGSPLRLKPDIAAPGLNITSTQTGVTCNGVAFPAGTGTGCITPNASGNIPGSQLLIISGTSMASPHMAGIMALLRELKPDWSVEELKALAMNYATHDVTLFPSATPPRFGPSRIGAGRVDPSQAAVGDVIAMNADDPGLVSVTFEPEVVGVATQTKKIRVVNKGTTAQTFDLAFDTVVNSPGVTFSVMEGSPVTVGAGQTVELHIQMSADASQMDHTIDPSLFATQGIQANYGDQPRNFLAEHEAYLTFSQSAALKFRLPVYMAEKPSSSMSAQDTIVTGGASTGSTSIALSGAGLCTGTLGAGPSCSGAFPTDVESVVSPFELQVVSPLDPVNSTDYADIHYVGVSFLPGAGSPNLNNDLITFGVASWGDWSTPTDVAYNICIDNNNDGIYEKIIYNSDPSIFVANASHNDNFVRIIRDTATNGNTILGLGSFVNLIDPGSFDSALHLNNVMILGATPSQLGYASTAVTTLRYKVVTCPGSNPACARTTTGDHCSPAPGTFFDIASGPYVYNWGAQGLNFGGNFLADDLNASSLPVSWNTANMTANGSLGALLLHHMNGSGKRAEVVLLDSAQRADLAITKTVDNAAPNVGTNVVFTITVTNHGPNNATGVVVNDFPPDGMTYVSDDGGGAYDSNTGLWTIPGTINNGSSATLHLTASVDLSGQICNEAQITAGSPLDPNPADNQATACINAPRTADLAVTVTAGPPTVNVGGTITYTVTLTNNGDDPAYNLITTVSFSPTAVNAFSNITPATRVFNAGVWNLSSLDVGASATLQFSIVAPNQAGPLTATVSTVSTKSLHVTKTTKAFDPNTGDNTATAAVTVLSPATIGTHSKTVSGTFQEGGTIIYTVTISNTSAFDQQNNPGDEFTDVLPTSLTLVGAAASSGTAAADVPNHTVHWNGAIVAGGSVTITITAVINNGTAGTTISNQGTIFFDADGNGTNESSVLTDDPNVGGATDPTSLAVSAVAQVPTLSSVGLALMALLLVGGALLALRRRQA
jgi:uncharacterized repeat protein (TIGR01451 family)